MYAIKGGWIGQTFALATCNESGGRKARIRRSKEERKAMVESFIKTYQSSNDGKFPSLNLTHKEVGGSFYTVREIVRDIIQENRVLGPAKFNSENQKFDGNTREFPLESATMESQDYLFQLEIENPAVLDQQASDIMEMHLNGNEQYAKHEAVDAGEFVASSGTDKLVYMDSLMTGSVGNNRESELVGASADYHGNMSMELDFQGNTQLDKHEDLDVEQHVYDSPIEESDDVVSTESSVSESFLVERGAKLEVTGWQENANLEIKLSDNEQRTEHEILDFGKYVNGSQVEESDKLDCVESSLIEKHEVNRNSGLVEANTTKLCPTEDIVVETFPLRPVTMDINTLDTALKLNDSRGFNGVLEKPEINTVKSGNGGAVMDRMESMDTSVTASAPVVQKAVNDSQASSSNGKPVMVHETTSKNATDSMKVEDSSRNGETFDIGTWDHIKPITASHNKAALLKTIDGSEEMTGAKARDDHNTVSPNNSYGAKTDHNTVSPNNSYGAKTANGSSTSSMELKAENPVMVGSANEIPKENQALKESKPTLDRINLESWEGASKKSLEQERNPLFVFLKSLVSAFMKFLSE